MKGVLVLKIQSLIIRRASCKTGKTLIPNFPTVLLWSGSWKGLGHWENQSASSYMLDLKVQLTGLQDFVFCDKKREPHFDNHWTT